MWVLIGCPRLIDNVVGDLGVGPAPGHGDQNLFLAVGRAARSAWAGAAMGREVWRKRPILIAKQRHIGGDQSVTVGGDRRIRGWTRSRVGTKRLSEKEPRTGSNSLECSVDYHIPLRGRRLVNSIYDQHILIDDRSALSWSCSGTALL